MRRLIFAFILAASLHFNRLNCKTRQPFNIISSLRYNPFFRLTAHGICSVLFQSRLAFGLYVVSSHEEEIRAHHGCHRGQS